MSLWTQYFPPAPSFTPAKLGSQTGKVFLVTGGASAGAKVYLAGRSEKNAVDAINKIKQSSELGGKANLGSLHFLYLDLSDLRSVAPAARDFLQREPRLDALWNNAGIGATFNGETAIASQGELPIQLVTNCVGPYLFTTLLQPALERANGARVVWTGSAVVDFQSPKGGMLASDFETPKKDGIHNYTVSKTGNWFLASALARRERARVGSDSSSSEPILHIAINPGNLRTAVWRTFSWLFMAILNATVLHDAIYGAYAVLWAGLSPELTAEKDNGSYAIPWGRRHPNPRKDILRSLQSVEEGGTGLAGKFYDWCEKQAADYR